MQRKFKSILQSKRKHQSSQPEASRSSQSKATEDQVEQHPDSHREPDRVTSDTTKRHSQKSSRSRPLSSIYSDRRISNASAPQAVDHAQSNPKASQSTSSSLPDDHRLHLPVIPSVGEIYDVRYMTLGGDRRLITGESDGRHEEDVADRNINRYSASMDDGQKKVLPASAVSLNEISTVHDQQRRLSTSAGSFGSTNSSVPSVPTAGKYVVGRDVTTKGGLIDSILPYKEVMEHEKDHWKKTDWPTRAARDESGIGLGRKEPRGSGSGNGLPQSLPENQTERKPKPKPFEPRREHSGNRVAVVNGSSGTQNPEDGQAQQRDLAFDGIVDLTDTVDTDQAVKWAPAVTHETIKPHEHEIVQHNIHREVHNYTYYHRLQPVIDTEILPPRHFIPNPNGEGLVEITVDELPMYFGHERQWDVVQRTTHSSAPKSLRHWRSEPKIITDKQYPSNRGFEHRETTILHPPTLEDMSNYSGPVQPVHFDHKTGESWLGNITTMEGLKELDHDTGADRLRLGHLEDSLPKIPPRSTIRRKPLGKDS